MHKGSLFTYNITTLSSKFKFNFHTAFLEGDKLIVATQNGANVQPVRQTWLNLNYTFVRCNLRQPDKEYFMRVVQEVRQDPRKILDSAYWK